MLERRTTNEVDDVINTRRNWYANEDFLVIFFGYNRIINICAQFE